MNELEEVQELVSYVCEENEKPAIEEIKNYVENKYGVSVFKVFFAKGKEGQFMMCRVFLKTNAEYNKLNEMAEKGPWFPCYPVDGKAISDILNKHNVSHPKDMQEGFCLLFVPFEEKAMYATYRSSFDEFKGFREKVFNPATMKAIDTRCLYVTYNTEEDLKQAEQGGEIERLKDEYFAFIKKFDTYDFITKTKHFITRFDSTANEMGQRAFSDVYADSMREL